MSNKKGLSIPFVIITLVIGAGIVDQIDCENYTFEKPALAVVYILTFLMSGFFLFLATDKKTDDYQFRQEATTVPARHVCKGDDPTR